MYVVGYSDTWDEWTVSEVLDEMLDFGAYSYGGRPATLDDVEVVTTRYYDEDWLEYGVTYYRYLIHDGMTLPEAFDIGYWYIRNYINDLDRHEDNNYYEQENEW